MSHLQANNILTMVSHNGSTVEISKQLAFGIAVPVRRLLAMSSGRKVVFRKWFDKKGQKRNSKHSYGAQQSRRHKKPIIEEGSDHSGRGISQSQEGSNEDETELFGGRQLACAFCMAWEENQTKKPFVSPQKHFVPPKKFHHCDIVNFHQVMATLQIRLPCAESVEEEEEVSTKNDDAQERHNIWNDLLTDITGRCLGYRIQQSLEDEVARVGCSCRLRIGLFVHRDARIVS